MQPPHRAMLGTLLTLSSVVTVWAWPGIGNIGLVFIASSFSGLILLIDSVNARIPGALRLHDLRADRSVLHRLLIVAVVFGYSLDIVGSLTARLWYYPQFDFLPAVIVGPLLYSLYSIILLLLYDATASLIGSGGRTSTSDIPKALTRLEGALSVLLLIPIVWHMHWYTAQMGPGILDISTRSSLTPAWWYPIICLLPLFLAAEWWCARRGKPTLTAALLHRNWTPLIAILVASFFGILLTEAAHIYVQLWRYGAWPLSSIRILGLPLLAIIVWPVQFLAFLAMLRAATSQQDLQIWRRSKR